jgi:hypothetical protein
MNLGERVGRKDILIAANNRFYIVKFSCKVAQWTWSTQSLDV